MKRSELPKISWHRFMQLDPCYPMRTLRHIRAQLPKEHLDVLDILGCDFKLPFPVPLCDWKWVVFRQDLLPASIANDLKWQFVSQLNDELRPDSHNRVCEFIQTHKSRDPAEPSFSGKSALVEVCKLFKVDPQYDRMFSYNSDLYQLFNCCLAGLGSGVFTPLAQTCFWWLGYMRTRYDETAVTAKWKQLIVDSIQSQLELET